MRRTSCIGDRQQRSTNHARETLILRRETHLDQLADKLREPLLSGGDGRYSHRDREYVRDLGLVAADAPLASPTRSTPR